MRSAGPVLNVEAMRRTTARSVSGPITSLELQGLEDPDGLLLGNRWPQAPRTWRHFFSSMTWRLQSALDSYADEALAMSRLHEAASARRAALSADSPFG